MPTQRGEAAGKSIIIIGAGIAGLSAGCYGRMNGYRTQIFERHNIPGGVCTAWQRKGYTIDGCIHWLVGSSPGSNFHRLWQEVGAVQGRPMIDLEEYLRVESEDGQTLILYANIDRLEQHLLELAPEDARTIKAFTRAVRRFTRFDLPVDKAPELYGLTDRMRQGAIMLPFLRPFLKWSKLSVRDFAERFRNPFLREALAAPVVDAPEFPMIAFMMTLAWLHNKTGGYPLGGSLPFARAIEQRYLDLGGAIQYSARVSKILVENDRAVGVKLTDGTEHRGDVVISAADGHTTIFDMLDGHYVDEKIKGYYENLTLFPPLLLVALGIANSFEDVPSTVSGISFSLASPVVIDGKERKRLAVKVYNFDPSLAPPGKTVVIVGLNSDYDRWKQLREDPDRYRAEKEKTADQVIVALEQRFPGISSQVEMRDVATPVTWERYTGNWRGSYEGWFPTAKTMRMRMSKTLPGLDSFYMAGQWVEPGGGLPPAVMSGRHSIQILCKKDKKRFVTTTP